MMKCGAQPFARSFLEIAKHPIHARNVDARVGTCDLVGALPAPFIPNEPGAFVRGE
jgi:hypothetical protein